MPGADALSNKEILTTWGNPPFLQKINRKYPIFTLKDLDSFFFLFFDNMASLIGILAAMIDISKICLNCWGPTCHAGTAATIGGVSYTNLQYLTAWEDMVFFRCLPGIGVAIIFGNCWYAWMAFKLAGYENRTDVTALPYGVNTPAGFLAAFSVMLPLSFGYVSEGPEGWAEKCWQGTATAMFVCGLFEICGAWAGPILVKYTARMAFFTPIAGVGFVWLGFVPFIDVMAEPVIGALPLVIVFIGFFSNKGKGTGFFGIPKLDSFNFLFIVFFGTLFKYLEFGKYTGDRATMWAAVEAKAERYAGKNEMRPFLSLGGFDNVDRFVSIVFPVAIQSFIETMENVEMAAIKGDSYNMKEAMMADGLGTIVGACFGSPLPTTVYIGHSRHKASGATAGYSLLNALVYLILTMSGIFPLIYEFVDKVSVGCSLVAVGLIVFQDTIERSNARHAPALACGLFFIIADPWNFDMRDASTAYCTRSMARANGLKNMWPGGGILCSLVVPAILCDIIDSKYLRGSAWAAAGCIFSLFGLMHGNNPIHPDKSVALAGTAAGEGELTTTWDDPGKLNEGWRFCIMYSIICVYLFLHAVVRKVKPDWIPAYTPGNGYPDDADDPTIGGGKGKAAAVSAEA